MSNQLPFTIRRIQLLLLVLYHVWCKWSLDRTEDKHDNFINSCAHSILIKHSIIMLVRLQNDGFRPSAWLSSSLAFYITWNLIQTCSSTWLTGGTKKKLVLYVFLIYYFPFVTNWKIYSWMKSCVIYYLLSCKVYYMNQKKKSFQALPPSSLTHLCILSPFYWQCRVETNDLKNIGTTAFWVKMTVKTWCMNFCVNQIKTENISC